MPDRALRERILAEASRRPSPTRREHVRGAILLAAAGVAAALVVFWMRGGMRPTGRPDALMIGTAVGAVVIAMAALAIGARRGRTMGGRPLSALIALLFATPIALLLWKVVWSSGFPGMTDRWPERAGYRCFWLSLSMMIGPLVALVISRRRSAVNHPATTGAALGAAVGAVVWVFVDLWCPVAYTPHLLIGHVLPLVLAIAAGAMLGYCVLGLSRAYLPRGSVR